jgi:hypothetical protein
VTPTSSLVCHRAPVVFGSESACLPNCMCWCVGSRLVALLALLLASFVAYRRKPSHTSLWFRRESFIIRSHARRKAHLVCHFSSTAVEHFPRSPLIEMRLFNILALLALVAASSQAAETTTLVRSLQGPGDGDGESPGGDGPGGDGEGPGGDGGNGGGGGGAVSDPPSTVPTLSPAPASGTVPTSASDMPSFVPTPTPGSPTAPSSPSAPSPSTSSVESWTLGWTGLALAVAPLLV